MDGTNSELPQESVQEVDPDTLMRAQGYSEAQIQQRKTNKELSEIFQQPVSIRDPSIEYSRLDISPSSLKTAVKGERASGLSGYLIKHVPLYPEEVEILGLNPLSGEDCYKVTFLFIDNSNETDIDQFVQHIGRPGSNSNAGWEKIAKSVLNKDQTSHVQTEQTKLLNEYAQKDRSKEILFIFAHGDTSVAESNKLIMGKNFEDPIDDLGHYLDAEDLSKFSLVLDMSCNEDHRVPIFKPQNTPYFGSLDVVDYRNYNGGKKTVFILNGEVKTFFNGKVINS